GRRDREETGADQARRVFRRRSCRRLRRAALHTVSAQGLCGRAAQSVLEQRALSESAVAGALPPLLTARARTTCRSRPRFAVLNKGHPTESPMSNRLPYSRDEVRRLLTVTGAEQQALFARARAVRRERCGDGVLLRGLIEISNYCQKQCDYCGMRRNNKNLER